MAKNKVINTVLKLRDEMSGGLLKVARNTKTVSKEMQTATRHVVAFKNKVVSSVTSAATSLVKLGGAAGAAVGGLAAKTGLAEAMDLEGYRVQLETATKDTKRAGEVMQYAIKLANATPFEGGELVAAASKLEMFGLKTERWLPVLGDAAAGVNRSMADVQDGFVKAVTTGEFESLKDTLSITKDMVQDFAKQKFGKGFLDAKGTITDMNLLQDALEGLLSEKFGGGMDKLSQTTKGLWSTVTGVTKNSLAKIMGMTDDGTIKAGSALDLIKSKVSLLADKMQQWQADGTIDRLSQQFSDGLGKAVEMAGQAFEWLKQHGDQIVPVLKGIAAALAGAKILQFAGDTAQAVSDLSGFGKTVLEVSKKGLPKLVSGLRGGASGAMTGLTKVCTLGASGLSKLGGGIVSVAGKLGGMIKAAGAFVVANPIVLGIAAAIAAGILLWKNWDKVKAFAQKLWAKIKEVFNGIKDAVVGAFNKVKDAATTLWNKIKDVFGKIKDTIVGAFDKVLGAAKAVKDFFVGAFKGAIDTIKGAFDKVKDGISGAIDKLKEFLGMDTKKNIEVNYHVNTDGSASGGWSGSSGDTNDRNNGRGPDRYNALGTSFWRGGPTWVNERGGEIINLPSGSQVIPHDLSQRMVGGPKITVNVTVQGNVIGNRQYAEELGNVISSKLIRALANT